MEAIADKHKALISGLTRLYETLVLLRYISPNDVVQPPHSSSLISTATYSTAGYDSEVIELMRLVPALRNEIVWGYQQEGTEILPRSKVVNYFLDSDDLALEWLPYLRWGDFYFSENTKLLEPWMLRLTLGSMYSGQYGTDLIYNTKNQEIVEWSGIGTKIWDESPSRPAAMVLDEIVANLDNLKWVPYNQSGLIGTDNSRQIMQHPIKFQNIWPGGIRYPTDMEAAIEQLRREPQDQGVSGIKHDLNQWWSLQKLFRDCGWGKDKFDGDEFERRRNEWIDKLNEIEKRGRRIRFSSESEKTEFQVIKNAFWLESVGEQAL